MERVRDKGARTTVVVLDACRNNPFERAGTRSVGGAGGLAAMSEEGAFVIYSASENQTALDYASDDDKDPNSVFTRFFVKELETPGLSLVQVAKRTQASVTALARKVKHNQRPAYYDEIVGDVVLNGVLDPEQGEGDRSRSRSRPSRRCSRSRCRSGRASRSSSTRRSPISCATMAAGR